MTASSLLRHRNVLLYKTEKLKHLGNRFPARKQNPNFLSHLSRYITRQTESCKLPEILNGTFKLVHCIIHRLFAKRGVKNTRFRVRTAFPDCLEPDLCDGTLDVVFYPPADLRWYQRRQSPTGNILAVVGGYDDCDVRIPLFDQTHEDLAKVAERLRHANLESHEGMCFCLNEIVDDLHNQCTLTVHTPINGIPLRKGLWERGELGSYVRLS
ncbi:hypothetical protein BDD12DRAFT_49530 [Trichophaea hybrida]|nr:hypothetical protein BDD12DRAFT_49530 [Trichophaea hybrida]